MSQNSGLRQFFGGLRFCRILFHIYPIGPVWGLTLGSYSFIAIFCHIYRPLTLISPRLGALSEVGGVRAPAHPYREIVFVFVHVCVRAGGRAGVQEISEWM